MKNLFKCVIISTVLFSTSAFANTYTVKYGDTFLGIALRHGLTQTQLQNLNPSVDIERLKAGTRLEIGNAKPVNRVATATVQQPSKEITIQPQQRIVNENVSVGVHSTDYQQPVVQNAVVLERVNYQPQYQTVPVQTYNQIPQYQTVQPQYYAPSGKLVIIDGQTYIIQPVQNIR